MIEAIAKIKHQNSNAKHYWTCPRFFSQFQLLTQDHFLDGKQVLATYQTAASPLKIVYGKP